MATAELKIIGLNELMLALRNLPPSLVKEAGVIVRAQAEAAAREIAGAYPYHSGNLREHLRVEVGGDQFSATARVKNTAKHAYIFETGGKGKARAWKRGSTTAPFHKKGSRTVPLWGIGKDTGVMPAGRVFIPIAIQRRRIMLAALIDIVERAGLHVSGAAA